MFCCHWATCRTLCPFAGQAPAVCLCGVEHVLQLPTSCTPPACCGLVSGIQRPPAGWADRSRSRRSNVHPFWSRYLARVCFLCTVFMCCCLLCGNATSCALLQLFVHGVVSCTKLFTRFVYGRCAGHCGIASHRPTTAHQPCMLPSLQAASSQGCICVSLAVYPQPSCLGLQ